MRYLIILLSIFVLTGCGFQPLYRAMDDEGLGGLLGRVELGDVRGPTDARDAMRATLQSRLPAADGDERYLMSIGLRETRRAVSVNIDSNTRRFNYQLVGVVTYIDRETNERRVQNLTSEVSFAVVPSQYASLVGREDAVRRAVIDLARKIETDAALYAQGRAPQESKASILRGGDQRDPLRNLEQDAENEARSDEAATEANTPDQQP